MTSTDRIAPAIVGRYAFAEANGIEGGICGVCGQQRTGIEFVHVIVRRGVGRDYMQRAHCTACVAAGRVSGSVRTRRQRTHGLTCDLLTVAETTLYPTVKYHRLTPDQRRHCYIVARRWWLATGVWQQLRSFNYGQAWADVESMTNALERRGLPVFLPPSPICNANVDAHD